MLLRLLAVIGAGAIAVFVILAVSTLYVVEGEGIQQSTLPSPAAEMRDQLRRSATPAPVRPAARSQEPLTLPVAAAPAPVPPAPTAPSQPPTLVIAPTTTANADTTPPAEEDSDRTGSVNPVPTPRVPPPPPAAAPATVEAKPAAAAERPARREAKAKPRATEVREKPQETRRKERRGAANCQTYRTYNAKTRTYRGYDGRIRSCP